MQGSAADGDGSLSFLSIGRHDHLAVWRNRTRRNSIILVPRPIVRIRDRSALRLTWRGFGDLRCEAKGGQAGKFMRPLSDHPGFRPAEAKRCRLVSRLL
jgi:hypothetical protein